MSTHKVSNESIRSMVLSYGILMWMKRKELEITDPVPIQTRHIQNRFSSKIWTKRIHTVFTELTNTHPQFYISNDVLYYHPVEASQ